VLFGVAGFSAAEPGCGSCQDLPLFLELAVCAAALQPKIREVFPLTGASLGRGAQGRGRINALEHFDGLVAAPRSTPAARTTWFGVTVGVNMKISPGAHITSQTTNVVAIRKPTFL
jgi:hypothetical protein